MGTNACLTVRIFLRCSKNISPSWKSTESDRIKSLDGCLLIFNEKSQVSLFVGALQFYLLHGTLLNVLKEHCRELISSERTVVACLPVIFDATKTNLAHYSREVSARSVYNVEKLHVLHESIRRNIEPLHVAAKCGLCGAIKSGQKFLSHLFFASHVCDPRNSKAIVYKQWDSSIYSVSYIFGKMGGCFVQNQRSALNLHSYQSAFD